MFDVKRLVELCRKSGYIFRLEGDDPTLVLVGEGHKVDCLLGQERIIEVVSPKVILHEAADPKLSYRDHTRIILGWESKYDVPVELCDIPYQNDDNQLASKRGLEHSLFPVLKKFGFGGHYNVLLDMTNALREHIMGDRIYQHVEDGNLPLVAVVGDGHVIPGSKIHNQLRENDISYLSIVQNPEVLEGLRELGDFFEK